MNNYIIRNQEGIFSLYYENRVIYLKALTDKEITEPTALAINAQKDFSLLYTTDNNFNHILYKDTKGNILINNRNKPPKTVLRVLEDNSSPIFINAISTDNSLRLFYNKSSLRESYITEQHRREDGSWSNPIILDSYIPMPNMVRLIPLCGNYVLFYSKKVPEQQIGYREITANRISEFKMLYATGYSIADYSLAVTEREIHLTAVVSTARGNKLIYLRKDSSGLSKAMTLYTGAIKSCQISIHNNKIIIIFSLPRGNSRIISYDMGLTFKRIEPIDNLTLNKCPFIDYIPQIPDNFVATELLTYPSYPYNVKYCPLLPPSKEDELNN